MRAVNTVSEFSPAKINLFLAITGRRADGYHDLVSVAAPLDFGDELVAELREQKTEVRGQFSLECDDPAVPTDGTNLVLKAATAFAATTDWKGGAHFRLTKRIPVGAGLGGGSSNAVAALLALNKLSGGALPGAKLAEVAASLGADCALFLKNTPVIMRGRGERIEPLPPAAAARVRGRRVLLFKPGFGISTAWAYARMAARGADYAPAAGAEARLAAWLGGAAPAEDLLANNLEGVAFDKYLALPVLLAKLRRELGVAARMSGSGSACFAVLGDDFVSAPLVARIRECWGPAAFVQEARLV
ncbi:MAG: 4-(cytidine 5'-diphospho)-2-C-methyl-D-erythritol kinase [Opitutae bacterium]|nr:4-(cytidine 5'-diphospho)-2-C-methyl-D-erythritol kinase [Opitutae bacterium]